MKSDTDPEPLVIAKFTSNCLNAEVNVKKVQIVIVGAIIGILIFVNNCHGLAPSMEAASYCEASIPVIAAMYRIDEYPVCFQTLQRRDIRT